MMNVKDRNEVVAANLSLINATVRKTLTGFGRAPSADDVADMASDCVVALLADKLEKFDATRGVKVTTYMVTCVRNMVIDTLRKTRKESAYDTTEGGKDDEGHAEMILPSRVPAADMVAASNQRVASIRAALTSDEFADLGAYLSPEYSDVADATARGCNVSAVRARKSRLMTRVRAMVE